jgi:hypothetical protein
MTLQNVVMDARRNGGGTGDDGRRKEGGRVSTEFHFISLQPPSSSPLPSLLSLTSLYTPESGKSLSWFPTVVRYRVLPAIGEIMFKKKSHTAMYPVA